MNLTINGCNITVPDAEVATMVRERLLATQPARTRSYQPALIGSHWLGGIAAGLTIHNNLPHELIVLPGEHPSMPWAEGIKWAEEQDASLPSRVDSLVCLINLRKHFKPEAYWTNEQYADDERWAWYQDFGYGTQYGGHKDDELRLFAVRRVPIQ